MAGRLGPGSWIPDPGPQIPALLALDPGHIDSNWLKLASCWLMLAQVGLMLAQVGLMLASS